jgi:hypothetical protein
MRRAQQLATKYGEYKWRRAWDDRKVEHYKRMKEEGL